MTLRETIRDVILDGAMRDHGANKTSEKVLIAMRDYVPSDAMQMSASLCSGGVRERWRSMIEAAIRE